MSRVSVAAKLRQFGAGRFAPGIAAFLLLCLAFAPPIARAADNEAVAAALRTLLQAERQNGTTHDKVYGFYQIREFKPIWTRDNGPKTKAKALLAELKISAVNGLSPDFYDVRDIETLMESRDAAELAKLETLLSSALFAFAHDLRNGRIGPDDEGSENAVPPIDLDPGDLVVGAEASNNLREYMTTLLTADFRYTRLIAKLSEFDRIVATKQWPKVDGKGAPVGQGKSDPRIADIRRLLVLSGDLPPSQMNGDLVLDSHVSSALRSYQEGHGLPATGDLDAATLADMAVPLAERIRQIKVNLERRRWQNRDLGRDYVYVNLADDSVKIVRASESEPEQTVTEGSGTSALPTFFGDITGATVSGGKVSLTVQSAFVDWLRGEVGASDPKAIVISDPASLAARLLEADANGASIESLVNGPDRTLPFAKPVPLFVTYVTAWANGDGSVHFRPDKFGRDTKLAKLLDLQ